MEELLQKIKLWFLRKILFRCPECGSKTNDYGYGEFCRNVDCKWMIGG